MIIYRDTFIYIYIYTIIYIHCLTNVSDYIHDCQKTMVLLENLLLVLSTHLKQLKGFCWLRLLFQFLLSAESSELRPNSTKIKKNQ